MKERMSGKERWMATLTHKPVDRLVFWPKISGAYPRFRPIEQAELSVSDFFKMTGADLHVGIDPVFSENRTDTAYEMIEAGDMRLKRYVTPRGTLTAASRVDAATGSWHPVEFPVKTQRDIDVLIYWYNDIQNTLSRVKMDEARLKYREFGDSAIVTTAAAGAFPCESPLMCLIEFICGVENAQYMLADYPDKIEELFAAIDRDLTQKLEITAEYTPADAVYMIENTSTTLISPAQYKKHCFERINAYGDIIRAGGKLCGLHMCGHIKNILGDLAMTHTDFFEALTPPSVGNTTLSEAREKCADKAFIGGTGAVQWLMQPEDIEKYIEDALAPLPHTRAVAISSGGELPPSCPPEYVRRVGEFVKNYPVRN